MALKPAPKGKNTQQQKLTAKKPDEDLIPYVCHYDPHTILTKNGELLQTIRITGFGTDSVAVDILSLRDTLRDSIVAHVKDNGFAFWFHTFRRKKNVVPKGEFPDMFSKTVNESWDKENEWSTRYVNELYITIITEGLDTSIGNFAGLMRSFSFSSTKSLHKNFLKKAHEKLSNVVTSILVDIEEYGAKLLGIAEHEEVLYSEPMRFFGKIINLYEERYPLWVNDIASDLASHKFAFGDRNLEVFGYDNKNFASMLSLKEYQESSVEALDRIMQLPFEFVISQSFDFNYDKKELEHYEYQDYLLKVSGDEECRYLSGVANFVEEDANSLTSFGKLQTTIMIISKSKEELEKDVKFAMEKFSSLGLVVIREDVFAEHCFWSQLPGNFRYLRRQKIINSYLVGGFAALHNFPSGTLEGNHWGSAVTVLRTVLDTPYFFNFHEEDLGHTLIIGPKNAGKTVLTNFLVTQSRKFGGKIFYFDHNQRSKSFIKVLGGDYFKISSDSSVENHLTIDPLFLDKNDSNKTFLSEWFESFLISFKDKIPQEQIDSIPKIVEKICADNVTDFVKALQYFNVAETKSIFEKMQILNSPKIINLLGAQSQNSFTNVVNGFDLTDILEQKNLLVPIFFYLLHKIEQNLDGTPSILVLDQAWNLVDNPVIMQRIGDLMERFRQKNCVIIFTSSDFEAINESDVIFEMRRLIVTEIYTANQNPDPCYKSVLELKDDEIEIITMMEDDERHFIFKHNRDSIIASLNLGKMPEIVKILSADEITNTATQEVILAHTDESGNVESPENWIPQLFEILHEIERDLEEQRRKELIAEVQAERKRRADLEAGV